MCLAPDLEPRSSQTANLHKFEGSGADGDGENGYDFSDIAAMVAADGPKSSNTLNRQTSVQTNSPYTFDRSFSMGSTQSTTGKGASYLDRIVKEWTSDPGIRGYDSLVPGKTLDSLNNLFLIRSDELPTDTMINSFTGDADQSPSHLAIRFAEEIVQNIFSHPEWIPSSVREFLCEIIENTKEGDAGILSLADAYVLTGFFIQKWVAFGFRWCLTQIRKSSTLRALLSSND